MALDFAGREMSLTLIVEIRQYMYVCLQNTARSDTTRWDPKCKHGYDLKQSG